MLVGSIYHVSKRAVRVDIYCPYRPIKYKVAQRRLLRVDFVPAFANDLFPGHDGL